MVSVLDVCMYPTVSSDFAEHYYTEAIIVSVCVYMLVCVRMRAHACACVCKDDCISYGDRQFSCLIFAL